MLKRFLLAMHALIFCFVLLPQNSAALLLSTIDDNDGDKRVSGVQLVKYFPNDQAWTLGGTCAGCPTPDSSHTFLHSWHSAQFIQNSPSVTLNFVGVALSVYCIIPTKPVQDLSHYSLSLYFDGQLAGNFTHPADPTAISPFLYNVSVFSVNNLENQAHSFMMSTELGQIILFDYATYISEDDPNSATDSSVPSDVPTNSLPPTSVDSPTSTDSRGEAPAASNTSLPYSVNQSSSVPTTFRAQSSSPPPSRSSSSVLESPIPTESNLSSNHRLPTRIIVSVVLSVIGLSLILSGIILFLRRRRRQRRVPRISRVMQPFITFPSSQSDIASPVSPMSSTGTSKKTRTTTIGYDAESSIRHLGEAVAALQTQQKQLISEIRAPPMYTESRS